MTTRAFFALIAPRVAAAALVFVWLPAGAAVAQSLSLVPPASLGLDAVVLERIPARVEKAIEAGNIPGAVVLVGRRRKLVFRRAFGNQVVEPLPQALRPDAIFDLASLTKCVATTTSILRLVESGKIHLDDRVAHFLPGFGNSGKEAITIEHLLRHRGGLLPDNHLRDYREGSAEARRRIYHLGLRAPVGTRYIYSDVGFIVLGWVVEAVCGETLDRFARREIFEPLGLRDTAFFLCRRPLPFRRFARCVPTERPGAGRPHLRARVHDPRARYLGGVAGHAGLFSTGDDLARFAMMLLDEGRAGGGARFLSLGTLRALRDSGKLPAAQARGLGWDLRPARKGRTRAGGRFFPKDSFGHTGFTGTSMWMDPRSRVFVIILSSRLYPDGKGHVGRLRSDVADLVASAIDGAPWRR